LKGKINRLLIDEDAFGLKPINQPFLQENQEGVSNQRFSFGTEPEQMAAFESWIQEQIEEGILDGVTRENAEDAYWQVFAEAGYQQGAGRSFNDVRKPALSTGADVSDFFQGTREEFLRQSFGRPVAVRKLKVLAGRTFTELKGASTALSTALQRSLTDGLAQGKNPRVIAKELNKLVDVGERRAETIARTEIIRAHAEGQLDALEELGVTEVGVMVEWSTAGDERVCPLCQPLEGRCGDDHQGGKGVNTQTSKLSLCTNPSKRRRTKGRQNQSQFQRP
jgi:SPP1 gp7 family putative phage head morphogenesis protein